MSVNKTGVTVKTRPNINPRWDKCGINPDGYLLADRLVLPITACLFDIRASEPSLPVNAIEDLAFIAKQVTWQIAEEMGMLTKKKPKARKRRARR